MDEVTKDFIDELLSVDEDGAPVMTVTIPAVAAMLPPALLRAYIIARAAQEHGYRVDAYQVAKALSLAPTAPRVWQYQITPNRHGSSKLPCRVVKVGSDGELLPGDSQCVVRAALFWLREYWRGRKKKKGRK